ncbi:13647_t:CDS:2 [Funneliformis mosseae]|uniref:13647_t:CDS:1 n=1 Tax=Funneliformis mosseae TaxID=27381 RepID=A0A9N8YR18_FUNMO|nr:13647_t:CDS:2 [Funneliformis mosseae]
MSMNNGQRKEMPCNWLLVGEIRFCKNLTQEQYCASHAFKIRKGVIIPQPCKGCKRGTKSSVQLCVQCEQEDIGTIYVSEFELDPLADFYYPALIPPLSILASRSDIPYYSRLCC